MSIKNQDLSAIVLKCFSSPINTPQQLQITQKRFGKKSGQGYRNGSDRFFIWYFRFFFL